MCLSMCIIKNISLVKSSMKRTNFCLQRSGLSVACVAGGTPGTRTARQLRSLGFYRSPTISGSSKNPAKDLCIGSVSKALIFHSHADLTCDIEISIRIDTLADFAFNCLYNESHLGDVCRKHVTSNGVCSHFVEFSLVEIISNSNTKHGDTSISKSL